MNGGNNNYLGMNPRMINSNGDYLGYNLYTDTNYTTSLINTTFANNVAGLGSNVFYGVFGKLFANQLANTTYPLYSDSITVTITY